MNTNLREVQHDTIDGDVYQYFESLVDKIVSSGEASDTKFLSFDSSEPPCPIGPGQFTKLKLTDGSCKLTSFTSSFIKLRIKTSITISPTTEIKFIGDFANRNPNRPVLFVGFRSGLHAIDHYRFYCDKGVGYICEQSQAVHESAITFFAKSQEEIEGDCGCYATCEDIKNLNKNVSGTYITYGTLADNYNKPIPIEFDVIIKYDDFAPLQFFKTYPNGVCGNLQLEFKVNNFKNLVISQVPLDVSVKHTLIGREESIDWTNNNISFLTLASNPPKNSDQFQNIGNGSVFYLSLPYMETPGEANSKYGMQFIECNISTGQFELVSAKSYINGYNVKEEKINQIRELLSTKKIYIPGQRIDQYSFSQLPTETNMSCNTTQSLVNCSAIAFTFPRTPNELTCSFNPSCSAIQLQIDNKTYPDKPFSTYDFEYSNYILHNLMFDDLFRPNHALMRSLVDNTFILDDSNFIFVVATERLDSDPFVFDGISKDNCFITLLGTFNPKTYEKGSETNTNLDSYSKCPNRQPPIMYLCQDTLWELSSEGVNYYYNNKNIIQSITNN